MSLFGHADDQPWLVVLFVGRRGEIMKANYLPRRIIMSDRTNPDFQEHGFWFTHYAVIAL